MFAKNQNKTSNTALFNEWHPTILNVSIHGTMHCCISDFPIETCSNVECHSFNRAAFDVLFLFFFFNTNRL